MASVLKITATLNFESDILNKDAGDMVKEAFKAVLPAIVSAVNEQVNPKPEVKPEERK